MAEVHQNFSPDESQIYVFKVTNINCCENCPKELKRGLEKMSGILWAEVDATQSLATVKALIDSSQIIRKIKKWGKKAELVHERKETKEDSFDASSGHKNSSSRHKFSFFRKRDKSKGRSHEPEKHDKSGSNVPSAKEIPDYICTDKYCTVHRRDDFGASNRVPNVSYGTGYSPLYRGGGSYSYPRMNSFVPPPQMYGPPPRPRYGQYYGPRMFAPVAGYSSYATQRQMPRTRPRPDGYTNEYGNGCNNM